MKIAPLIFLLVTFCSLNLKSQTPFPAEPKTADKQDNWTKKDLIEPAALAAILKNPKANQPVILNIGVAEDIKNSSNIGAASKKDNLEKLNSKLKSLPKSTFVVLYCGCCPFERCPNIRPAVAAMKNLGFSRGRLLNIPTNLKQDWISHGYPMLSD